MKYEYYKKSELIDQIKCLEHNIEILEERNNNQFQILTQMDLEKAKYRWHDLRKNPDDFPKTEGFYWVYALEHNYKVLNNNYVLRYADGRFEFHGEDGFEVIGWKEIEPFEVEE